MGLAVNEQCLHRSKDFPAPHAVLSVMKLGVHQDLGTQPGQLTQNDQRDVPYHMTLCSAIKLWGVGWGIAVDQD